MKLDWLGKSVVAVIMILVAAFIAGRCLPWLMGAGNLLAMLTFGVLVWTALRDEDRRREVKRRIWLILTPVCVMFGFEFMTEALDKGAVLYIVMDGIAFFLLLVVVAASWKTRASLQ